MKHKHFLLTACLGIISVLCVALSANLAHALTQQDSGSAGVEGTIPATPPTQAPTISTPSNGQVFSNTPITVAGLCQNKLLVEVFKNGVFGGSVTCVGGSYSIKIDLFSGRNDLIVRDYDSLNQASPDSNPVNVTFNSSLPGSGPRISLTTNYAKRGAVPGDTLTWPITVSGGATPYAFSVDWGDKSAPDLMSWGAAGDLTLKHIYNLSGVYNVTIRASDADGSTAYLQVVGIGNGPIQQTSTGNQSTTTGAIASASYNKLLLIPIGMSLPLLLITFWLGKRQQLQTIRTRLRKGERPFK